MFNTIWTLTRDGIFSLPRVWDKKKIWDPDGNRNHELPTDTDRALLLLSYWESLSERGHTWTLFQHHLNTIPTPFGHISNTIWTSVDIIPIWCHLDIIPSSYLTVNNSHHHLDISIYLGTRFMQNALQLSIVWRNMYSFTLLFAFLPGYGLPTNSCS